MSNKKETHPFAYDIETFVFFWLLFSIPFVERHTVCASIMDDIIRDTSFVLYTCACARCVSTWQTREQGNNGSVVVVVVCVCVATSRCFIVVLFLARVLATSLVMDYYYYYCGFRIRRRVLIVQQAVSASYYMSKGLSCRRLRLIFLNVWPDSGQQYVVVSYVGFK